MNLLIIVVVIVLIVLFFKFKDSLNINKSIRNDNLGIGKYFKAKSYFFTKSEIIFFDLLEKINNINNSKYTILSKVRLEDIVSLKKDLNYNDKKGKRGYIKSKHLDFILLNKNKITAVIELDGKTHDYNNQKKSDLIKDEILNSTNVKFYRIKVGEDFRERIEEIFLELKNNN